MNYTIDPETGWLVRTRNATVTESASSTYLWTGETRSWTTSYAKTDTIKWSGQGPKRFHGCSHTVVIPQRTVGSSTNRWLDPSGFSVPEDWASMRGSSSGTLDLAPLIGWVGTGWGGISSASAPAVSDPSIDWVSAKDALYADLLGKWPSDISVPLNVIEFAQLKRMVPGFARSLTGLVDWCKRGPKRDALVRVSRWNDPYGHIRQNYWKRVRYRDDRVSLASLQWGLKDLSSSYLAVQFGLKPLISDVTNWVTKYYQLKLKSDWFNRMATGQPTVFHSRTPNADATAKTKTRGWFNYGYAPANLYGGRELVYYAENSVHQFGTLGCIAKVRPKSPTAQLSAMLASTLGVNAPLQTVWDIIPFSFVVDWVLPIGKTLQRADDTLFGRMGQLADRIEIMRTWHSITRKEFSGYTRPEQTILSGAYAGNKVQCDVHEASTGKTVETYQRNEGWPGIGILPARKGWSMFASATSAALILQRMLGNDKGPKIGYLRV